MRHHPWTRLIHHHLRYGDGHFLVPTTYFLGYKVLLLEVGRAGHDREYYRHYLFALDIGYQNSGSLWISIRYYLHGSIVTQIVEFWGEKIQ